MLNNRPIYPPQKRPPLDRVPDSQKSPTPALSSASLQHDSELSNLAAILSAVVFGVKVGASTNLVLGILASILYGAIAWHVGVLLGNLIRKFPLTQEQTNGSTAVGTLLVMALAFRVYCRKGFIGSLVFFGLCSLAALLSAVAQEESNAR